MCYMEWIVVLGYMLYVVDNNIRLHGVDSSIILHRVNNTIILHGVESSSIRLNGVDKETPPKMEKRNKPNKKKHYVVNRAS